MRFEPWVSLEEALLALLAPTRMDTIFDIGQAFAREPGAPHGDWTVTPRPGRGNPARAYVVKRMAQTAGVDVRSSQRWIAKFVVEERNPSKANMAKLRAAAGASQTEAKLLDLEIAGTVVDIRATIIIEPEGKPDRRGDKHRTIMDVYIPPDGHRKKKDDQLWQPFIDEWRAGNYEEATVWWQLAYFDALGLTSGSGEIIDVEMLVMQTLERAQKRGAA